MVDPLFSGGSNGLKLVLAAIAVIAVIAVAFWALRRLSGRRLRGAARGRVPRLAVIDSAPVDGRRRLVLIRRDNVEHLIMIGGPSDVVVEQNILRAAPAREAAPPRPAAAADALPGPVPLTETSLWPLQPEPAPKIEPSLRAEPRAELSRPETPPPGAPTRERRVRATDALAGLAEELSRVATAAPPAPAGEGGGTGERPAVRRPVRPLASAGEGEAKAAPPAAPPAPPVPDQNLTEMAQRLEAALRRPSRSLDKVPEKSDGARPAETAAPKPASEPAPHAPAAAEPAAPKKSAYDNLEEEMASLLGRPNSKP